MKIENMLILGAVALGGLYLVGKLNLGKLLGGTVADVGVGIAQGAIGATEGAVQGAVQTVWNAGTSWGEQITNVLGIRGALSWMVPQQRFNPGPPIPRKIYPSLGTFKGELLTFR